MNQTLREIYGAGVVFFYYLKWPFVLGYLALIYGLDYPRHWSMDIIWIYCAALIVKDFIYIFILGKKYGEDKK
jgi:hypothetical protein